VQSFFDIWLEVSTDGGVTWTSASSGPGHLELGSVVDEVSFPTADLPPPNGEYFSSPSPFATFAPGVVVKDVVLRQFTQSIPPPPPAGTASHSCGSLVDFRLSTDGGATFTPTTAPATLTFRITSLVDSGMARYFDTEMLALDIASGGLPAGVMIRESPTRSSPGRTSTRSLVTMEYMIDSFFDVFTELSTDGGQTWSPTTSGPATLVLRAAVIPPLTFTCPSDVWLLATSPAGAVINYPPPTVGGGCPLVTVTCNPPSGSTFPVGTTTVNCTANDTCGQSARCSFQVTVRPYRQPPEIFFGSDLLPPSQGVFISPGQLHAVYANGVIIRDVRHRNFTQSFPPPAPGAPETHSCGAVADYQISLDGGQTFTPASAPATATVLIAHTATAGGTRFFDTEMLALEMGGGGGGGGGAAMIRESPTRQSLGRTSIRTVTGGFLIESFFDVWTEVSLDGGLTWTPALDGGPLELRSDPLLVPPVQAPTSLLPPLNEVYASRAQWSGIYAAGIILKDLRQKFFTQATLPPQPGGSLVHYFDSEVDFQISTDGGNTFQHGRAPAGVDVRFAAVGSPESGLHDMEVLSLTMAGGDLPSGVMLRASPTLPSTGVTEIRTLADGTCRVTSFFDVFTELSTDGGQTWMAASSEPARMELRALSEEEPFPTSSLPPLSGGYFSLPSSFAAFAQGVHLRDVVHRQFDQSFPPPPLTGTATHACGSLMDFMLSTDGGATFTPTTAPATLTFRITSRVDSGATRYFDTEMLALDIAGGGLPTGMMIRESPTRSSLGRTSTRSLVTEQYLIDSFFDIFTELSTDAGQTWSPAVSGHVTLILRAGPCVTIDCPPDIVVDATPPGGAVVTYTVTAADRCGGQSVVTPNPPSGSVFPIGTTTVLCQASSANGTATCSFTVTVYDNQPVGSFTALPNPAACGQAVSLDASSSYHGRPDRSIVKYEWNFGDGTVGAGQQVTHAFSAFDSYAVTLTVTDNNVPAKTDTASITVQVDQGNQAPVAVAGGPYAADLGSALTLDGSGSSDPNEGCGDRIVKYTWDIAGGRHVLSGMRPGLSPAEVDALGLGKFPVVLTVTDEFGATGSASTTLDIYDNRPFAVFTAIPNPAGCGQVVGFDASASRQGRPDRRIVSYAWDFGDATTGIGQSVTHAFNTFNSYNVTLTVTDNNVPPKTAIASTTLQVDQGNRPPVADPGGPYMIIPGDSLRLDGSASSDPDAGCGDRITRYEWDLNLDDTYDQTGSTPVLPPAVLTSYGLGNPGSYRLRLQVTDAFGLTHTGTAQLTVWLPRLQCRTTPGRLTVFWPRGVEGFQLQSTESLIDPRWQPVPAIPSGEEYAADLDSATGAKYLRLVK
jgi:PKD repeat protein